MADVINIAEERAKRLGRERIDELTSPAETLLAELANREDKIPALTAAACRMLINEIEAGRAQPRKLFICYCDVGPWHFLAFKFSPDELRTMVRAVAADLEKNPPPEPPEIA